MAGAAVHVAPATMPHAVDDGSDSDGEMSDSPDFVFDTGAAGEPVEEDEVQDTDDRPPSPLPVPADAISDMITAR